MNLMLTFLFLCIALGLLARRLGLREHAITVAMATAVTGLYFFARRFM